MAGRRRGSAASAAEDGRDRPAYSCDEGMQGPRIDPAQLGQRLVVRESLFNQRCVVRGHVLLGEAGVACDSLDAVGALPVAVHGGILARSPERATIDSTA